MLIYYAAGFSSAASRLYSTISTPQNTTRMPTICRRLMVSPISSTADRATNTGWVA